MADLEGLDRQIRQARREQQRKEASSGPSSGSYGMRAGMDLVSGVAVGTGVGYALDAWLETLPWFSLGCFCLGLAAGLKLMMETAAKAAAQIEQEDQEETPQNGR